MSVTVRAHGAAEFRQSPEWRWNCSSAAGGLGHVVRLLWLSANRGDSCPLDWWFAIAFPVYATALATGLRSRSAFLGVRSSANLRRWSIPYMVPTPLYRNLLVRTPTTCGISRVGSAISGKRIT